MAVSGTYFFTAKSRTAQNFALPNVKERNSKLKLVGKILKACIKI